MTDAELVTSVKDGDKGKMKDFYLSELESFKTWITSNYQIGNSMEAKDLYQDAIIILMRNIREGKLDQLTSSLKTYLFGIGKNLARKRFDQLKKAAVEEYQLVEHFTFTKKFDVDDSYLEMQGLAATLVRQMDEPCKSILIKCYYEGLSMREIAMIMNYKNESVVRNQKARCMKRLKDLITSDSQLEKD